MSLDVPIRSTTMPYICEFFCAAESSGEVHVTYVKKERETVVTGHVSIQGLCSCFLFKFTVQVLL